MVQDLEEKGVQVINSKEELEALKEGVVVIRSHGVGKQIYELLEAHQGTGACGRDLSVCEKDPQDCPEKQTAEAGRRVIIVGNPSTTRRSQGISGWGNEYHSGGGDTGGDSRICRSDRMKSCVSCRRRHLITINFKI